MVIGLPIPIGTILLARINGGPPPLWDDVIGFPGLAVQDAFEAVRLHFSDLLITKILGRIPSLADAFEL
ncbi:hypothetical protein RHGRI_019136 [Rhododendron griersonianum]|uniref:Uncharacterized protein n=1 Tax=Rhododendron griersonianum TaxID=479676 RepID=A0AAV6JG79_9ERIC|nr:hypothetical protein RHGRI_019136 [Rhododendron griersonianum]